MIATIVTSVLVFGISAVYIRGAKTSQLTTRRTALFVLGLALMAVALLPPLNEWPRRYFYIYVLQELLLTTVGAPLFIASDPYPILKRGLPQSWQNALTHIGNTPKGWVHRLIKKATSPGLSLLLFISTFWFWFDPYVQDLIWRNPYMRVVELITRIGTGMLYWWHIIEANPRIHLNKHTIIRTLYAFAGIVPIKIVGLIFLFTIDPLYVGMQEMVTVYGAVRMNDQTLSGGLIWLVGGTGFTIGSTILAGKYLDVEAKKTPTPFERYGSREALRPPGLWGD